MNRLILVGNGFDLAHGMKTRYSDFLLDYLKSSFIAAEQNKSFKDNLITITQPHSYYRSIQLSDFNTISDFVSNLLIDEKKERTNIDSIWNDEHHYKSGEAPPQYKWEVNNVFTEKLIKCCSEYNWVDIENQYYEHLKYLFEVGVKRPNNTSNLSGWIRDFNDKFFWLISYLERYLSKQSNPKINDDILRIFKGVINRDEVVTVELEDNKKPEQTLILNFNYTSTAENYIQKISSRERGSFQINYIHGKLDTTDNPIIFGYGDEVDATYLKMEEFGMNSLFDYIKSFWYFKTSNYHNLIKFIEQADFQTYIMGHSCGLSDRTMLKMIFEHDNCKSIKLFYHQTQDHNNFTELTQQISKHFTNKGAMRKKIVPFEKSSALPQCFN